MGWRAVINLFDGLSNLTTGMGISGRDKSQATEFVERTLSEPELHAMYRDDWIARKIVDVPAYDMTREGREWKAIGIDITDLERAEKQLQVWPKTRKAKIWARLYGGAALILDDGTKNYKSELRSDGFAKGRLKTIHVASRRRLTIPAGIEDEISSSNFGLPKMFTLNMGGAGGIDIHPSRVIPVFGETTPDTDVIEDFWGDSTLRAVYGAIQQAATATQGFAQLIHEAKVDIVSVQNLISQVSTTDGLNTLLARWGLAQLSKSMNGVMLLDREAEEYTTRQINFANHDKILREFLIIVSGAADIPATRMLGQSPSGLNATGESDLRNYYDNISGRQETDLRPILDRLDAFLVPHALGSVPEDLWYGFRPLWQPTAPELATIHKTQAEAIKIYAESGIVDGLALKEGAESLLIEIGLMPGFERALEQSKKLASEGEEILQEEIGEPEHEEEERTE